MASVSDSSDESGLEDIPFKNTEFLGLDKEQVSNQNNVLNVRTSGLWQDMKQPVRSNSDVPAAFQAKANKQSRDHLGDHANHGPTNIRTSVSMAARNEIYSARVSPPPPLPEVAAEDRLGVRCEIAKSLGGPQVKDFVENIKLSHTIRLSIKLGSHNPNVKTPVKVLGLSEVDTFEKLKSIICSEFGQYLAGCVQSGSSAYITGSEFSYPAKDDSGQMSRQVLDIFKSEHAPCPPEDDGRQYTNRATHLKTKLTHSIFDCPCGECDSVNNLPEISVRMTTKLKRLQQKLPSGLRKENIIRFEELRLEDKQIVNEEQQPSHDMRGSRLLINREVLKELVEDSRALKAENQDLELKLRIVKNLLNRCCDDQPANSSSDEEPLVKGFSTKRTTRAGAKTIDNEDRQTHLIKVESSTASATGVTDVVESGISKILNVNAAEVEDEEDDIWDGCRRRKYKDNDENTQYDPFEGVSREDQRAIKAALGEGRITRSMRAK